MAIILFYHAINFSRRVYLGQLGRPETQRLLVADAAAIYAHPSRLLFVRDGALFAQNFDVDSLTLTGNPFVVVDHAYVNEANWPAVHASALHLVLRSNAGAGQHQLVWFDRSGKELAKVGSVDTTGTSGLSISPDGRNVAMQRTVNGNIDIWTVDLDRGIPTRFTTDPGVDRFPIWSPDGRRIVFDSNRKGAYDLYEKSTTGSAEEKILLSTPQAKTASDWSVDGRFILFRSNDPNVRNDIWALPYDKQQKPFRVVQTDSNEWNAQFAPNGKWIVYDSEESGRPEIYIQQFPEPRSKTRISNDGGSHARWRKDGRELFYVAPDRRIIAVPIRISPDGQTIQVGNPLPLFDSRAETSEGLNWQYVVSADGKRFLVNTVLQQAPSSLTVILNWQPRG